METDYLYSIHRDFNHRTRGVTASSMQSTVGAYHLNVPLCQGTLDAHGWAPALRAAGERLRRGQADVWLALAVEVSRRHVVRQLVEDVFQIAKKCGTGATDAPTTPSSTGPAKGNRPNTTPPTTTVVMAHHINELLTGWILHERNDPQHEALIARLRVVVPSKQQQHECDTPSHDTHEDNVAGFLTSAALYDVMYPVGVNRDFVLASDVGQRVVPRGDAVLKPAGEHGKIDEHNGWVLASVVNQWRGVFRESNLSSSPTTEQANGAHPDREEELADWRLAIPAREVVDVVIPSSDLEPRGSSTAVFIRCSKWCGGDKTRAAVAARDIALAARRARAAVYESLQQAAVATTVPPTSSTTTDQSDVSCCSALRAASPSLRPWTIVREMCTGQLAGETVDLVELRCGNLRCPMLLRAWHKMRALYDSTVASIPTEPLSASLALSTTTYDDDGTAAAAEAAEHEFDARLLIVLLRYASLCGASVQNVDQTAGFHAAVPPRIYAALRESLHTVVEGFASPMNATSTRFCSLFPDCDSYFGSVGSFFHLTMAQHFPRGVSMSCNPPYSVIVMLRVSDQLSKLYEDAESMRVPLQVFVVVCNWEAAGSKDGEGAVDKGSGGRASASLNSGATILHRLRTHKFCQRHVSLEPRKAPFQDGHAFVLNRPFFTLASNTEVYLFQNSYAHEAWPTHRHEAFDRVVHEWSTLEVSEARQTKRDRDDE